MKQKFPKPSLGLRYLIWRARKDFHPDHQYAVSHAYDANKGYVVDGQGRNSQIVTYAAQALREAAYFGKTGRMKRLMALLTPEDPGAGASALVMAVSAGQVKAIHLLRNWGVKPSDQAIQYAIDMNDPKVGEALEGARYHSRSMH